MLSAKCLLKLTHRFLVKKIKLTFWMHVHYRKKKPSLIKIKKQLGGIHVTVYQQFSITMRMTPHLTLPLRCIDQQDTLRNLTVSCQHMAKLFV